MKALVEGWQCPICGRWEDGTGPCAHTRSLGTKTLVTSRENGDGYYERRDQLLAALREYGPASVPTLKTKLGWTSYEVTGKLQSARMAGLVIYSFGYWKAI